jgi:hypothetical protein
VSFQGINPWDTDFTINSFNTIYYIYWLALNKIYANLMISVKNLMSDQHIVNKNFLDEFTKLRTFLLEEFDTNWCNLSENGFDQELKFEILGSVLEHQ